MRSGASVSQLLQEIADPRAARPLTFVDRPYGRLLSRTDWGPDAAWLTFKCSWMSINHQNGDCNQFEFYRKGEWLTKERSGYADDMILMTSDYHNTLALQNDKPANPNWFDTETIERGGQWTQGAAAGDPATVFSTGQGYVFAQGDGTNLYNRPPDAMTIRHASRSLVWLCPSAPSGLAGMRVGKPTAATPRAVALVLRNWRRSREMG